MAGIFENIFTHEDENAGLKAIGHQNMQDEEVKQFNLQQKNEYQKIREQNKKDVFNFEDDETVKSKGKYTLMEVYDNHQKYKLVPYAGSGIEAYNDFKIFSHLNTLKKGGILTPEQVQETRDYIKTMREQELRGYTLPARVEQTILESSPYLVEAGIGFATAEYGVGLGVLGDTALKFGARQSARNFAKKEIRNQLKKQINKDLTKRLIKDSTLGTARFTIEKTPTQFLKKAGEMMIADDIAVTERGQYILNEAETNPATTFMKALGDTMIENFSETSGVLFGGVAKNVARTGLVRGVSDFIHRNILENLPKGFTNGFKNLVEKTTKMSFGKALRQFGYYGILEEIGEERIGDFLRFAFDLDSEKGYSGRQLWSALFPDKEQLMTEAIAFGLTGGAIAGGLHGIKRGVQHYEYKSYAKNVLNASKNEDGSVNYELLKENIKKDNPTITDEKLNNIINAVTEGFNKGDKYTIDDFMVDTGIVRTPYKHSISNERIAEHLKETGMKDEDIQTILDFATDEDKAMLMSSRTPVKMTKEQQKEHAKIKEDLYNKLVNIGTDSKEADNISIVTGAMYERFGTKDEKSRKVFNDYMNNLVIRYNIPANQSKKYNQPITSGIKANQKVNVVNLSSEFSDAQNLSKKDLSAHIKSLIGTKGITSKDKKAIFNIVKSSKRTGKKNVYIPGHIAGSSKVESKFKGERNTSVKNIVNLLQNSVLIEKTENKNKSAKPEVDNYLRFYVPVRINNNVFTIRIVAENNEKQDLFNILNADVYDVIVDKKIPTSSPSFSSNLMKSASTDSINDNAENFNPDELTVEEMLKGVKDADGKAYFQSAFHGTPHKFDEFSTDNIGTGEGAQAHGWGLYFAGDKEVSEGYRRKLSGDKVYYNGQEIKKAYYYTHLIEQGKEKELNRYLQDLRIVIDGINKIKTTENISMNEAKQKFIENYESKTKLLAFQKKLLEIAKNIDTTKIEIQKGQLFEVDIPDSDVLLDEDKPLNEQPDKVKKAILEYYKSRPNDYIIPKDINSLSQQRGKEFYRDVAFQLERENSLAYRMANGLNTNIDENFNPGKEASLLLNSLGIKGITYDGKQDGRCYVVFDDKAIKVLKTYYQDSENGEGYRGYFQPDVEEEKLIAGFTYPEVLDKLTELYESIGEKEGKVSQAEIDKIMAKVHILEDAFQVAEGSDKFKNEDKNMEIMLNAYYIMNNQEIPQDYIDADAKSQRTYRDYKEMHDKKKEELESNLYDYYRTDKKHVVTIMANKDSSTALHEFGHVYLDLLEELAKVNDDAKQQLESVQKWLGYSGEWTTAQHEKFAGSFVAYLYKGKAPSNKLRTVFENFKEWLKSVYHSVLDIPDAEISDEVQELFDNIFGEDSYYQEKKEATALLRKVRKQSKKERLNQVEIRADRTLTDVEKRCKEVSYDILSVATGKDKKYLMRIFETDSTKNGYGRRREVVEELLDSVDDKITASGGMRGEWTEFYGDTGVSYENDEIDGDYNLASQALWTILNKDYFDPETRINNRLDEEADYFARAVDKADREYKILLSNYKRGNRNVVLSAVYEWIDSLDSQIKQDYEDRFIFDSGIIDRNENADKFDKAKRQILKRAMELESQTSINKNEKYQEIVKEIIKGLNFLQPSDKAKLTSNILDVPSTSFLMASIDNIMDIAKTMEDVNLRRNLEREIHKELQQTKNVKKNGRTVGKYNYKTNKLFEELRNLDRLSPEKANEMRLENKRFAEREDSGMSYADKLINKFLSYKAGGRTFANTELMKELYDEITRIKLAGKSAKDELDHMEKLTEAKDIEELISIVQNKKEANPVLKLYINAIANLESTINAIFNNDIKEKYASEILYAETQSQAWQHEQKKNFESAVAKIYNLPVWNWDFKILQYLNEKHTFAEIRRKYDAQDNLVKSRLIDRTLTKMDIIQAYIWSKNEILDKRLKNQFGKETLESMFELLTKEDEQLAEIMMRTAQSFYPLVNKAFIQKYGLDLPKVSCYFPSTPERGSEVDLYNDYSSKSLGNGFTKSRANSETQAMDFHNPIATLYSHIEGVSKFVFMSSALDTANLRFKDKDLKRVIVNKYGDDAYRTLEQALMNVTYKKEAPVFNGMNKILDNLIGNWIQANVSVKPIVGLKQLLSANNYAVDMPYMKWQVGFLKALSNPKGTIDYMMSIPYIKARYEGSFSNEFLKQTVENSAFAMSKKLKDCCNLFIKMGDIGAIIFGGKPYIDYLIKDKGMSESEAIKQFILSTNRSQQSSAVSSLSNFQVNMSRSSYGKLMIAFKNSPQQYARMCGDAIISACNGDITKGKMAKMLFQYAYLQPFLYTIATSGSLLRWIFAGDDDDFLHDMKMSIFNLNMNALPLVGDIYQHVVNVIETKKGGMTQTTPLLGDIEKEINKLAKEDSTLADWLESLGYIGLHVGAGYNTKAVTTMGSGVGDIADGNFVQGAMKVLGYTDKRAKHIAGNEKKK